MEEQYEFIFTFEGQDFKLRKSSVYECWVNGKFEFGFSDKNNFFGNLYEKMLRISFGKYGYAQVNSVLKIYYDTDLNFHQFLDLYGEFKC